MAAFRAGADAWRRFDVSQSDRYLADRYIERWAIYTGTFLNEQWKKTFLQTDVKIYRNASLLLKHVEGVVDFYAATVYQGDLSTDGSPLPNSAQEAIPIDPQTGDEVQDEFIRIAFAECCSAWNWKQNMSQRPLFASALGDVLTELIDDVDRKMVYPSIVWPGYVKDIELDYVGNVKYYALEYRIVEKGRKGLPSNSYVFRKEVDTEEFRFYRDGEPYDQFGDGAVVPNPYGFVPAIWDRHRPLWDERGGSAIDGTKQALVQLNSLLSHSFDFQRKAFIAPIMVKGNFIKPKQSRVQLSKPPKAMAEYEDAEATATMAESLGVLPITGEDARLLQPVFDIGKTREIVKDIFDGILQENPEASFWRELRKMSNVTGPGAERILGDAVMRCRRARAGYDVQTIKLFQMAIAMCGMRANDGSWGELRARQQKFLPFDLDSFKDGMLDFGIKDRPIIPPTEAEQIELILLKERIETDWGRAEAGMSPEEIENLSQERENRRASLANALDSGEVPPVGAGAFGSF